MILAGSHFGTLPLTAVRTCGAILSPQRIEIVTVECRSRFATYSGSASLMTKVTSLFELIGA